MNEQLKALFENAGIVNATEFSEKAGVLFEATVAQAVTDRVKAEMATVQENFDKHFTEAKSDWVAEQAELVEAFMKNAVVEWAQENGNAIDARLKTEIAESILESLRDAFSAQGVEVPASQIDVVEAANKAAEDAKVEVAKLQESLAASQAELITFHKAAVLAEATEGMSEFASDKVQSLAEGLVFKDLPEFTRSVNILAEAFGKVKLPTADELAAKAKITEGEDGKKADDVAPEGDDKGVDAGSEDEKDGKDDGDKKATNESFDIVAATLRSLAGKK